MDIEIKSKESAVSTCLDDDDDAKSWFNVRFIKKWRLFFNNLKFKYFSYFELKFKFFKPSH